MKTRTQEEMFELILSVAKNDERIRGVILNGSRANKNAKKDIFQDYDILYIVRETESFLQTPDWVSVFGERLIFQFPDEVDRLAGVEIDETQSNAYLMQFTDGTRIDLTIALLQRAVPNGVLEKLSVVLLDKDSILPVAKESDEDFWVKRPTQEEFDGCTSEFWWVFLYAAKGLWRGEELYAMDCMNQYIRPELLKLTCWATGLDTAFSRSMGKSGKELYKYLSPHLWESYLHTFPTAEIDACWDSLFIMADLFELFTTRVIKGLSFTNTNKDDSARSRAFAEHIRRLPKTAQNIFND